MSLVAKLSPAELLHAGMVGFYRNLHAISKGRERGLNSERATSFEDHIQGACAEYLVARELGVFWDPSIGKVGEADLASNLQVRLTYHPNGRLILHPEDGDDDIFILVVGADGDFSIEGWIGGAEGKLPEYWKDPKGGRPAFFVPRGALYPFQDLPVEMSCA